MRAPRRPHPLDACAARCGRARLPRGRSPWCPSCQASWRRWDRLTPAQRDASAARAHVRIIRVLAFAARSKRRRAA